MLINQELLRTFVVAAKSRTFGDAARARHVTTSAISQQIKLLERQIGATMFERVGRNVRLTDEARQLAIVLEREFAAIDAAVDGVVRGQGLPRGEVRIGAPRPFAAAWLRPRFMELMRTHAELRLRLCFGGPTALGRDLAAGDLDFAILVEEPRVGGLSTKPLFTETFVAYASPGYLKKHGKPVFADDFAAHRFVAFDEDLPMHAPWWRAAFGARAPMVGSFAAYVESLDELLAAAEAGVAIAVLPDYFAQHSEDHRRVGRIATRRSRTRASSPARSPITLAWRSSAADSARLRVVRDALLG